MELREVTLLNFDNTYQEQPQLSRVANEWIELQDIPGTNLYCSGQAWQKLTERIPENWLGHHLYRERESSLCHLFVFTKIPSTVYSCPF